MKWWGIIYQPFSMGYHFTRGGTKTVAIDKVICNYLFNTLSRTTHEESHKYVDSEIFMSWWLCNDLWQMDLYFYSAFSSLLNVFCNICHIHPFTHTFTHWWQRLLCKVPSAHQEQCGVQRHFYMQPGEPGIRTSHLPITGQTTLLPVNVLGAAPLMCYPPVCCLVITI